MSSNTLIIAHGDLDGVTSAALLAECLEISIVDLNVIFTQPHLVDQIVIPEDVKKVYVVDIAINNRDPKMTEKFIESLGDRLIHWYDHHEGWPHWEPAVIGLPDPILSESYKNRTIHIETVPACALMFGDISDIRIFNAVVADTREGTLQLDGAMIDEAIKADMGNDDIRRAAVGLLMGDESKRPVLETAAKAYQDVQTETERIARFFVVDDDPYSLNRGNFVRDDIDVPGRDYMGTIAYVNVPYETVRTWGSQTPPGIDLTQLLLTGQRLAKFAVARTINFTTGDEMVTIATKSGVNLVELFGLPSGAPFRISLPADRLDEVLEKLK